MLRTVTAPSLSFSSSSTCLIVSTQNKSYLIPHSLKLSSPLIGNINKSNSNRTVTCNYKPSRRLALFQLGAGKLEPFTSLYPLLLNVIFANA